MFEYICGYAAVDNAHNLLLGIYKPGSEAVTASFFSDLTVVLEQLSEYRYPMIVCGDLNIHVDVRNDKNAKKFARLLDSFE